MFGTSKRVPPQLRAAAVFPSLASTILGIAVISGIVNLLALTAPIFMLQVYDRVLSSRSIPTLVGLSVLALGMYAFQAALEIIRSRVLVRVGESFDHALSGRVFQGIVRLPLETKMPGDGLQPLRDLDNVRAFLSSPAPTAIFDLPWMPFYLAICFLFDFWLGATALIGTILLVAITIITDRTTAGPTRDATQSGIERNALTESVRRNAETVRALGLNERFERRWQETNQRYLGANRRAADIANGFGSVSRSIRVILQSAILAVGAWLVVEQRVSGGVMIASSIMMGRALAPVDLAIGSWKPFLMARQSWGRLRDLFALVPQEPEVTELPRPQSSLSVEAITVAPPGGHGRPTVTGISFSLAAGSALGIIGPSGSGKSTLIRALVGAWMPVSGHIRFDGANLQQWNRAALGQDIGYLPQSTDLFDGTIAANIARFDPQGSAENIVAAAKDAGVHDAILKMEKGYETAVGEGGSALSAGQRQRVGLARALYNRPFLVVLDEPNANLDAEGEAAVIRAIAGVRERGGIAIVVAHRPSAVEAVDHLMIVDGGRASAFGRRDDVLSQIMRKAPAGPGGFSASGRSVTPLRVIPGHNSSEDVEDSNRTLSDADK